MEPLKLSIYDRVPYEKDKDEMERLGADVSVRTAKKGIMRQAATVTT
jgi:hypothetical protein